MMRSLTTIFALFATTALLGCVDKLDGVEPANSWQIEEELEHPAVEGVFVAGHLGNYWDCPDDGYDESPAGAAAPPAGDFPEGDCADGECRYFMNCEDAQVTVRLSNTGDEVAYDLQVTTIELFDADGVSRAILPLMDVTDVSTNTAFDGELGVGEERILRIDYQGPASPYELLNTSESGDFAGDQGRGILEVTFTSSNHNDVIVISTELASVPSIQT